MGFLDRLNRKVADKVADAKIELESSALVGEIRREREGMQPVGRTPAPVPSPEDERRAAIAGAVARGGADPTALLTVDEVEVLTGDRVGEPLVHVGTAFSYVVHIGERGRYRVASLHGTEGGPPWDVDAAWDRLLAGYPDATPIDDLGEAACRSGSYTLVRAPNHILFTEVTGDGIGDDEAASVADLLLRGALTRLPDGPATAP